MEDYYSGTDIEKMEEIARQVPLSHLERPKWDIETMQKAGFLDVSCDEEGLERSLDRGRDHQQQYLSDFFADRKKKRCFSSEKCNGAAGTEVAAANWSLQMVRSGCRRLFCMDMAQEKPC